MAASPLDATLETLRKTLGVFIETWRWLTSGLVLIGHGREGFIGPTRGQEAVWRHWTLNLCCEEIMRKQLALLRFKIMCWSLAPAGLSFYRERMLTENGHWDVYGILTRSPKRQRWICTNRQNLNKVPKIAGGRRKIMVYFINISRARRDRE